MGNRVAYENLSLVPSIIATTVCNEVYTGEEISIQSRSQSAVEKTEAARQKMTREQIKEFTDEVDARCRIAYAKKFNWFEVCAKSKTNRGRDQLYRWVRHWLSSYLDNPKSFMRRDFLPSLLNPKLPK